MVMCQLAAAVVTVVDNIAPSITAPAMVSVVNTPGSCMASVNLGTPVTSAIIVAYCYQ